MPSEPIGLADIHLHLLPDLDDGSPDEQCALDYARRMAAGNVHTAACTPHLKLPRFAAIDPLEIGDRVQHLQEQLDEQQIDVSLHAGAEIDWRYALNADDETLDAASLGPAQQPWLLLEAPFVGIDEAFCACAHELLDSGRGVVIAHPERSQDIRESQTQRRLHELIEAGAQLQCNSSSLMGRHDALAQRAAISLCQHGWCELVGSDGHPGSRNDTLAAGPLALAGAGLSGQRVYELCAHNPLTALHEGVAAIGRALAVA